MKTFGEWLREANTLNQMEHFKYKIKAQIISGMLL